MDELQSYKDARMRQKDKTVASIIAKRDQQISDTKVKLQEDLKTADKKISSFHKNPIPEFKSVFRKKSVQKSNRSKQSAGKNNSIKNKSKPKFKLIKFFIILVFFPFYVIGFLIRFIILLVRRIAARHHNKNIDSKISSMKKKKAGLIGAAQSKIKYFEEQAMKDSETAKMEAKRDIKLKEKEIEEKIFSIKDAYDKEVEQFYKRLTENPAKISPLVDHIMNVFKSMDYTVKHEPLIILDLKFEVTKEQLKFDFDEPDPRTGRKKIEDDERNLLFFKEGLSNLTKDSECEGMAMALAQIAKEKMEEISPTMMVTFDQNNTTVIIHTKDINPNGRLL